jgi:hypothetical protein
MLLNNAPDRAGGSEGILFICDTILGNVLAWWNNSLPCLQWTIISTPFVKNFNQLLKSFFYILLAYRTVFFCVCLLYCIAPSPSAIPCILNSPLYTVHAVRHLRVLSLFSSKLSALFIHHSLLCSPTTLRFILHDSLLFVFDPSLSAI